MVKYTFIVPVYNTEKYLKKCLNSLVHQEYKDYEIITINDGSTDKSNRILLEYKKRYNNITVIKQKNQGLSMARNKGVERAKGKYIIFVDSDDYVSKDLLKKIDEEIENVDVLRYQISEESKNTTKEYREKPFKTVNGKEAFKYLTEYHFLEPAWCYVIKKDYYQKNKFTFKKGMYHEDFGLIPAVIYKAKQVKSIDYIAYHYIIREGSIMNNQDYQKTTKKAFDMLVQYEILKNLSPNKNKKNNYDDYFLSYISNSVIVKARELKGKERKEYIMWLKRTGVINGVLVNTKKRKLKKILMKLNLNLYLKVLK